MFPAAYLLAREISLVNTAPSLVRGHSFYEVVSASPKECLRRLVVSNGSGRSATLDAHRYALVGRGEKIAVDLRNPRIISVVSSEDNADLIPVTPYFQDSTQLRIGGDEYPLRIEELSTTQQIEAYTFLEAFHYKTASSTLGEDTEDKPDVPASTGGGRRAVLMASIRLGGRWEPIGYIELQMPFLMVKPRHELFALPFEHPDRPVAWNDWGADSIRKNVNLIARIARVVTSPEYRGLGVSRLLIVSAKRFAGTRWHIGGRRALFLEISAEMLRYLDFVSSSGFVFVGNTEGNLSRIHADLTSMRRGYAVSSGIMSLQKKYLARLESGAERIGCTLDELVATVDRCAEDPANLNELPPAQYFIVKSVLRTPIPYYIVGLDCYSEEYVNKAAKALSIRNPMGHCPAASVGPVPVRPPRVGWSQISIVASYEPPATASVRSIVEAFGLEGTRLSTTIVGSLKIEASGGNIILIVGPSGTGKSLLLRALDPAFSAEHVKVTRRALYSEKYTVASMQDPRDDVPIIDAFTSEWGIDRALQALNYAGLSEAFVYLKPYRLLSRGQKYRARLAHLSLRPERVWLLDEFCSDLDPLTACVVASNLRKFVVRTQRIAFVAAANHRHFFESLRPTRVIQLRHGFEPRIMTFKEYADELRNGPGKEVLSGI